MSEQYVWQTVGHTHVKHLLEAQFRADLLAHAYVFLGPDGVGKRMLAEEFALRVTDTFNIQRVNLAEVSVQDLRLITASLALKPLGNTRQVVIFDGAESMSLAAANSLLKTLEEPMPGTMLILVASGKSLLPTILSRSRVLLFGHLSDEELRQTGQASGLPVTEQLLMLSGGSPARLRALSSDPAVVALYTQWHADWETLIRAPVWRRLGLAAAWAQDDSGTFAHRLRAWMTMAARGADQAASERATYGRVLEEAWVRLFHNANKKLVLEYICLNL